MTNLLELVARRNEDVPLDVASLELASIEFPDLTVQPWVELLDSYANELRDRVHARVDGPEYIRMANEYLFDELEFRGNDGDYYSPLNSCLNQVLMDRTGLPITLSLVYIEIGRRLGRPVHGVGLPGHFLVAYDDGEFHTFLDPFHKGRQLEPQECLALASRVTGMDLSESYDALEPVSKRQMALRMLNNLRAAYLRRSAWAKALRVQNLLVDSSPDEAIEYRQRGYLHLQMKHYRDAWRDLEHYLQLAPEARDKADVEKRLKSLRRWSAGMN